MVVFVLSLATIPITAKRSDPPVALSVFSRDQSGGSEFGASVGVVICLGRGGDLHMAKPMPLPLTVSYSSKSRLVLPFWCRFTRVVPDKFQEGRKTVDCVCVCVCVCMCVCVCNNTEYRGK